MRRTLRYTTGLLLALLAVSLSHAGIIVQSGPKLRISGSGGGDAALFLDPFTSGYANAQNGISWGGTVIGPGDGTVSVSGGTLNFAHANANQAGHLELTGQLPLNFGREIWFQFDLLVPTTYSRVSTASEGGYNNKFLYVWTGVNNDFDTDYGDVDDNEVAGFEYWQNDSTANPGVGDGNSSATTVDATRNGYQHFDSGNLFTVAQRGNWATYCLRVKLGTARYNGINGDGVLQIWRDGTLIHNTTNAVLFRDSGNSLRWFYLWGYQNTNFTNANTWRFDNVRIGKTNICGVP